jgi:ABC-2 type transport system permease protein
MIIVTIILVVGSYLLVARRDLGAGLLAPRPGPAGSTRLSSPFALAWRLQRGPLLGWAIAYGVIGAVCGAAAGSIEDFVRASSFGQTFLIHYSGSPDAGSADIFLEMIVITLGMVSVFYSALATLQLRSEEVAGHAELVLSTTVGRMRWIASHLVIVLVGTVIILAAGGFCMGLVRGLSSGDFSSFARVFIGTLLHAPAAWLITGAALLLFGIMPRFVVAMIWVVVLYVQLIGEVLGPILLGSMYRYSLINALQPFHWVPRITSGGAFTPVPLLGLTGLSILLIIVGLAIFQRRTISS